MRAIWEGSLSFGLINIPVHVYSAVKPRELSFHLLHKTDLSPIRYARVCRRDGKEIPYRDVVKGYEYEDGDYITLLDKDFKKAHADAAEAIDVVNFSEEKEIDPMFFEKPYYLEPDTKAKKAYALLVEALKRSKKVGVVKFVIHDVEHLGVLRPEGNMLILEQLRFNQDIREPKGLKLPATSLVKKPELSVALELIDELTKHFEPEAYRDTYADELKGIIAAKAKGKAPHAKRRTPETVKVRDLMAVLKKSLAKEHARESK